MTVFSQTSMRLEPYPSGHYPEHIHEQGHTNPLHYVRKEVIDMPTATMTSKGQVTIPKAVRDALGLTMGSVIDFVPDDGGFRLTTRSRSAHDLFGMFANSGYHASVEEMDDAIAEGILKANNL
jgi:AbrB family looped-hinge helix DNA binding protein